MIHRVEAFAARHAMFALGARLGVAVSGGADSVCLLHVLRELPAALPLAVIHINHLLRGAESDADQEFVRELAREWNLDFVCDRIPVASMNSGNLEETAREIRRGVFQREIQAGRVDRVALAHTRSDQAETVLFRFLRGAYLTGLAGMRPVTVDGLVRPLLEIDRSEVIEYLQSRGLLWREDRTNQDPSFSRNRIRHHLLPELTAAWNPNLPALLAQHAALAQDDEDYWEAEVDRIAPRVMVRSGDWLIASAVKLNELPPALTRRLIRRAFYLVKGDLREIDFRHLESASDLVKGPSGHYRIQAPGVDILRSFDQVRFAQPAPGPVERDFDVPLPVPGVYEIPRSVLSVSLDLVETQPKAEFDAGWMRDRLKAGLDWNRIQSAAKTSDSSNGELLVLRNWRPGDAIRRVGDQHEHKLKTLFHEERVPLWERRDWPVITAWGRIVWSRKFGPAADFAADASTSTILRIVEWDREKDLRLHESRGALLTSSIRGGVD